MQEQSDVFVIGMVNDLRGLAAEQTRRGRFSHIVFVDLPTFNDRREIFAVHLCKRNRSPESFDLDELADVTEGYSGAEVEAAVKAAWLPHSPQTSPRKLFHPLGIEILKIGHEGD